MKLHSEHDNSSKHHPESKEPPKTRDSAKKPAPISAMIIAIERLLRALVPYSDDRALLPRVNSAFLPVPNKFAYRAASIYGNAQSEQIMRVPRPLASETRRGDDEERRTTARWSFLASVRELPPEDEMSPSDPCRRYRTR